MFDIEHKRKGLNNMQTHTVTLKFTLYQVAERCTALCERVQSVIDCKCKGKRKVKERHCVVKHRLRING